MEFPGCRPFEGASQGSRIPRMWPCSLPDGQRDALDRALRECRTPAYLFDARAAVRCAALLEPLRREAGLRVLYAVKALPLGAMAAALAPALDGFAVSSRNEAELARRHLRPGQTLHLTSPGLRADDTPRIGALCSHVAFNSLGQAARLAGALPPGCSPGLRVNPRCSSLDDPRYDPCRPASRLGEPVEVVEELLRRRPDRLGPLRGVHFHVSFAAAGYEPVLSALERVEPLLERWPGGLDWINLGGGVLPARVSRWDDLRAAVLRLRSRGLEVFHEPGKGLVGECGRLVTSVVDRFTRDGTEILVLDTSVAHHPEVFEYGRAPALANEDDEGRHRVLLSGASCLAGDLFGEYRFDRVPEVGERLVFTGVGAYSLVKANRFNGIPLPEVWLLEAGGGARCLGRDGPGDFLRRWDGDNESECLREVRGR
ncbi:MAG: carboxynorspermidine decarboxylase [Gammaproteobacteria bacterium]|nr:MAG: carboxynorspermidine decarboxylase [Gammaproteobacteria bacterium]